MSNMSTENTSPFLLVYYGLRFSGLIWNLGKVWPLVYTIYQVISVTAFGTLGVLEIVLGNGNLRELILCLSSVSIFIQIYFKQIKFILNEREIREFLSRLSKYRLELLEEKEHHKQITTADHLCRKYMINLYIVFATFPLLSFISNFIIDYLTNFDNLHLSIQLWIPWEMHEFWGYFSGTSIIFLLSFSSIITYISVMNLQLIFTIQMSAFLKILQNNLERKGPKDKMIYYHHGIIIELLKEFNKLFSTQMYVEILVGSMEPCGFGYALIKGLKRYEPAALDLIGNTVLCLFASFILCSCGQEISTQIEKLHTSAYMNNWYEEKPKIRRNLFTMMEITIKPMSMNYRLFVKFNYESYAVVIQGVYSYLMMVSSFEKYE